MIAKVYLILMPQLNVLFEVRIHFLLVIQGRSPSRWNLGMVILLCDSNDANLFLSLVTDMLLVV